MVHSCDGSIVSIGVNKSFLGLLLYCRNSVTVVLVFWILFEGCPPMQYTFCDALGAETIPTDCTRTC